MPCCFVMCLLMGNHVLPTVNWPFPAIQSCFNIFACLNFLQVLVLPVHHQIIFITELLTTRSTIHEAFLCVISVCLYRFDFSFMFVKASFSPFKLNTHNWHKIFGLIQKIKVMKIGREKSSFHHNTIKI